MGIGDQRYEGCNLDSWYRTRGSVPFFPEKHIVDVKFYDQKKPFQARSSVDLASAAKRSLELLAQNKTRTKAFTQVSH